MSSPPNSAGRLLSVAGPKPAPVAEAILSAQDVGVSREGFALAPVSLALHPGELVAILGPNGAGKSTLLRALAGTLPAQGEVLLLGQNLRSMSRSEIAQNLAFVTQEDEPSHSFSVEDVVAMGRAPHLGAWLTLHERDRNIVRDCMGRFGLTKLSARKASSLSGGERKRVALARAFAQTPKLLLLDEPSAALDLAQTASFYELLSQATKDQELAAAFVVHDPNVALRYASRGLLLGDGKVLAQGPAREVFTREKLEEAFQVKLETAVAPSGRVLFG